MKTQWENRVFVSFFFSEKMQRWNVSVCRRFSGEEEEEECH